MWPIYAAIIGQAIVIHYLIRVVKTFGRYSQQLVEIHHSNIMILERTEEAIGRLEIMLERPVPPDEEMIA